MRRPIDILELAKELSLTEDLDVKRRISKRIFDTAYKKGVYPASINSLYFARGKNEVPSNFTVPAINLRTLTLDLARAIFRVAKRLNSGAFIFEIAKSETAYTDQPPTEYSANVLAAAVCEDWQGPVFIQGDHFQVNPKRFQENPEKEIEGLKALMLGAIEAGFYNIDIDSSTLVELSKSSISEQQRLNFEVCAELTKFIRKNQPRGIEISVGGEIGEVGGKNSTPEELHAFMRGFRKSLRKNYTGISKISVQTGTTHGGVVLADGSIAKVKIDFDTLKRLSIIARSEYGLAGCVQHGASTLPSEAFGKFVETETAEIHLATEFQNMVYESRAFPPDFKEKMYDWIRENCQNERKEDETEEQFIYKTRKKALGPFKREIIGLPQEIRDTIAGEIEGKFEFLFRQLNAVNNRELIDKYVVLKRVIKRKRREVLEVMPTDTEGAD